MSICLIDGMKVISGDCGWDISINYSHSIRYGIKYAIFCGHLLNTMHMVQKFKQMSIQMYPDMTFLFLLYIFKAGVSTILLKPNISEKNVYFMS